MNEQYIQDLLNRYQRGECTPEEEEELELWYQQEISESDWNPDTDQEVLAASLKAKIDRNINKRTFFPLKWMKYSAAAILLLAIGVSVFLYRPQNVIKIQPDQYVKNDIEPGGNKAILTLADGTKLSLTDAPDGELAAEAGITITKNAGGLLVYTVSNAVAGNTDKEESGRSIAYNTISTPRGGRYRVNLPDGTQVWLNSESSLKFPTSFINATERDVHLNGEAYFEVSENKRQPFRVRGAGQVVQVLGTHFNVMDYPGEPAVETTLLEGKVSVVAGNKEEVITPGQQLRLKGSQMKVINDPDLDGVMAWKNNLFQFDNTDLEQVLREIERWYDVDIEYQNGIPDVHFTGVVPRDLKVSSILRAMEQSSKVKFKIEGRKIKVTNN